MNYLIPIGFIARTTKPENRLYFDNITLDSSVFIIKTQSSLLSSIHLDLHSGELIEDILLNEIKHHRQLDGSSKITIWRCHNIPMTTEPKYKQAEANAEIDQMWQEIIELPSEMNVECRAINVHETASMTLIENEPQLFRVNEDQLQSTPIDATLLKSVSLINEIVSLGEIGKNKDTNEVKENDSAATTTTATESSAVEEETPKVISIAAKKGTLIFNDGWNEQVIENLLKLDERGLPMVEKDPYIGIDNVQKLNLGPNEVSAVVSQLFDAINRYRVSKDLEPIKQQKLGPNDSCLCKSGQKFKKCHGGGSGSTSKYFLLYPSSSDNQVTKSTTTKTNTSNNKNKKKR